MTRTRLCIGLIALLALDRIGFSAAPVGANAHEKPNDPIAREISALIAQLSDEQFAVRQAASTKLESLGLTAYKAVRAAERTAIDPETKARLTELEASLSQNALWNGKDTIAEYAKRMDIAQSERTIELGEKKVPLKLLLIPAGEFTMGSPASEDGRLTDEAQHKVRITRAFMMGATAVTQAQWGAVMGTDPSGFKGDNLPVEFVSWNDATAFCVALNRKMAGETFRLPTEAEYEFACRAGTTTAYNIGAALDVKQVNYMAKHVFAGAHPPEFRSMTVPVGTFKPNAWGLYEMHGNVWQWCSDWFGEYPIGAAVNPQGPGGGELRCVRGGSWIDTWEFLRSAKREHCPPTTQTMHIGFRVVAEVGE